MATENGHFILQVIFCKTSKGQRGDIKIDVERRHTFYFEKPLRKLNFDALSLLSNWLDPDHLVRRLSTVKRWLFYYL